VIPPDELELLLTDRANGKSCRQMLADKKAQDGGMNLPPSCLPLLAALPQLL